jgi:hypothetical protein
VSVTLIAFELAGKDRERRETPVLSRLKLRFTRCTNVVERDFPLAWRILAAKFSPGEFWRPTQTQTALYAISDEYWRLQNNLGSVSCFSTVLQ